MGKETRIHKLAYFDKAQHVLYVSDNNDGIFRICSQGIERVSNGTDGVLFLRNPQAESFRMVERPDPALFDKLFAGSLTNVDPEENLACEEMRILYTYWLYSLYFGSVLPTHQYSRASVRREAGRRLCYTRPAGCCTAHAFKSTPFRERRTASTPL